MPKSTASKLRIEEALTAPLSVAFRADEREKVRAAAFLSDQSVSAFIRAAAVKAAQRVARQSGTLDRAA